jgi:predicted Fe-Mo cluster-binding NifX family protein
MNGGNGPEDGGRIAITSTGRTVDSAMDPRFGRCAYFVVTNSSGTVEHIPNTARALGNGAGIQAARQIVDMMVGVVVTGDVGPNAFRVLSAAGVKVFVGGAGSVQEVLDMYRQGRLRQASASTAPGHHGMEGHRWGRADGRR